MPDTTPQDGATVTQVNGQAPGAAAMTTPPSGGAAPVEDDTWWSEAQKQGFKSKGDVYKSWSEANKKISDQGEELKNFKLFQENVVPVLDVVLHDEEILGKVKTKMTNPVAPTTPAAPINNQPTTPPVDKESRDYAITDIANNFEMRHGIDKLDAETQKEIKAKIGNELKKFITGEVKLGSLPTQMEDAFALAVAKDVKLKSIFEAKADDGMGDYGSLPSMPTGNDKGGEIRLTPDQERVASRMPGGRDAYIKGLKKMSGK